MVKFLLTLSFAALSILAISLWQLQPQPTFVFSTIIFLFLSTAGLYRFLVKTRKTRPDYFVQVYLLSLSVKLIASLVYLLVVVVNQSADKARDIVFFVAVYFVFTAIEVSFLYGEVNRND